MAGGAAASGGKRPRASSNSRRNWTRSLTPSAPVRKWPRASGEPWDLRKGPVWWKEGGYLFGDIHNNRRMKYVPGQGVSVVQEPTNRANGLTRDLQGRLLACEHDSRRVTRPGTRREPHGDREQLPGTPPQPAQRRRGQSDGSIYFTDPNHNIVPEQ